MKIVSAIECALRTLSSGEILSYPTEAVYALGCNPFDCSAVTKLLSIKQRELAKGFIILIANWSQLLPLIGAVSEDRLELVRSTWPGHISWVFPKSEIIPAWISGDHTGIAIRMSAHPVAAALCADGAIISTSANRSGYAPAVDLAGVSAQFPHGVDAFFMGDLGVASAPSSIYDVLSSRRLR